MDGMSDVGSRVAQITAQLNALRAGSPPFGPGSSVGSSSVGSAPGATGTSPGAGTAADGTAGPAASFNDVLATAISGQMPGQSADAAASTSSALSAPPAGLSASGPTAGHAPSPAASSSLIAARMALSGLPGAASGASTPKPIASYPTDLSAYGNGRIPSTALKPLGVADHRLWAPAADNFRTMRAAAARDGVSIGVNDSYRSYAEQVDMVRRKGLYSQGGLAAAPGTSEHGLGKSVDLRLDSRAMSWMRANADEYGFRNNVPREPWHWTYKGR